MSRVFHHFSLFVGLSLLLHLGIGLYFNTRSKAKTERHPTPFFVDLRTPSPKIRELDLPGPSVPRRQATSAKRLGASDQAVNREEAPSGNALRDTSPLPATQTGIPSHPQRELTAPQSTLPIVKGGTLPSPTKPILSREVLYKSASNAAQSIAELDPETNQKMRKEVAEGRAVWLDMEKDILGSFYKRFRSSIEDVWIYPQAAISNGKSGVCLYRIVINRAGIVVGEPQLLQSTTGSKELDAEAARAVREASPRFGFLPDAYPYETLVIYAWFDYRLGNRPTVYGEPYYR